jgi:hypothetical protein
MSYKIDSFIRALTKADSEMGKVTKVLSTLSKSQDKALWIVLFEMDSQFCKAQQALIEPKKPEEVTLSVELKQDLMKQGMIVFEIESFCKAKTLQARLRGIEGIFENRSDF